jgi:shikimate kinase
VIHFLVGHRGVGKTTFLKRIQAIYQAKGEPVDTMDLDAEIEKASGERIADIFAKSGEGVFRKLEREMYQELVSRYEKTTKNVYIAIGAGFEMDFPESAHCLWLRRATDPKGRVFLDRPRLRPSEDPLDEYHALYAQREQRYRRWAQEQHFLQEGAVHGTAADALILGCESAAMQGTLTVFPWMLHSQFFKKRLKWGVRYFELRDDILNRDQLTQVQQWVPREKLLLSLRRSVSLFSPQEIRNHECDNAIERREETPQTAVVSMHEKGESFLQDFDLLLPCEHQGRHVKYAPVVNSMEELWICHQWWRQNPEQRSFLPRSPTGRWAWYRALFGPQMKIGFFREDEGSAVDQPVLNDWLVGLQFEKYFCAILGDPVDHSWTPAYQSTFFAPFKMPVVRIALAADEATPENLECLRKLGMICAAVTSPLKAAFTKDRSINTVAWDFVLNQWQFANTDADGLTAALAEIASPSPDSVVVWGGGGTLEILKDGVADAAFYSVRSGAPRAGSPQVTSPRVLIWAASPDTKQGPPSSWQPSFVLDLNYVESSRARIYALQTGATYVSGATFFYAQARAQQIFWQSFLEKRPWLVAETSG